MSSLALYRDIRRVILSAYTFSAEGRKEQSDPYCPLPTYIHLNHFSPFGAMKKHKLRDFDSILRKTKTLRHDKPAASGDAFRNNGKKWY